MSVESLPAVLKYISHIDGWLSSHEGYFLYKAAQKVKSGEIVEIGSWMGKSTICLASGSKSKGNAKVTAIDPHKGEFSKGNGIGKASPTFKKFQENIKKAHVADYVRPILATSEQASKKWNKKIGLLFIDGLHDYTHTKQDFLLWTPFLQNGDMVAFHDAFCGHDGPEKVVQEEILSGRWNDIGVVGSIIFAKKGKPQGMDYINYWRHRLLILLALKLQKSHLPESISFFLIHRVIKLLLLNHYTFQLLFQEV